MVLGGLHGVIRRGRVEVAAVEEAEDEELREAGAAVAEEGGFARIDGWRDGRCFERARGVEAVEVAVEAEECGENDERINGEEVGSAQVGEGIVEEPVHPGRWSGNGREAGGKDRRGKIMGPENGARGSPADSGRPQIGKPNLWWTCICGEVFGRRVSVFAFIAFRVFR